MVPKVLQLCQVQLIQCQCGRGLLRRSLTDKEGGQKRTERSAPLGADALAMPGPGRSQGALKALNKEMSILKRHGPCLVNLGCMTESKRQLTRQDHLRNASHIRQISAPLTRSM